MANKTKLFNSIIQIATICITLIVSVTAGQNQTSKVINECQCLGKVCHNLVTKRYCALMEGKYLGPNRIVDGGHRCNCCPVCLIYAGLYESCEQSVPGFKVRCSKDLFCSHRSGAVCLDSHHKKLLHATNIGHKSRPRARQHRHYGLVELLPTSTADHYYPRQVGVVMPELVRRRRSPLNLNLGSLGELLVPPKAGANRTHLITLGANAKQPITMRPKLRKQEMTVKVRRPIQETKLRVRNPTKTPLFKGRPRGQRRVVSTSTVIKQHIFDDE